jgi:hypothetical protein
VGDKESHACFSASGTKVVDQGECLPMTKGLEMIKHRYNFDVNPEMVGFLFTACLNRYVSCNVFALFFVLFLVLALLVSCIDSVLDCSMCLKPFIGDQNFIVLVL